MTNTGELARELEALANDRASKIAYRGEMHDAVAYAAHAEAYRQASLTLAQLVQANLPTILTALRPTQADNVLRSLLQEALPHVEAMEMEGDLDISGGGGMSGLLKRLWCALFHHRDKIWQPVHHSWRFYCCECGQEGLIDD